jgi:hypothetical protein
VILLSDSSQSPTENEQLSREPAGQRLKGDLTQVPTNRVKGVGNAVVGLNGTLATVSVHTTGLLDNLHLMHIHAGGIGQCPPKTAARPHNGNLAISATEGNPWYGKVITSLTRRGSTSRHSILAFTRYPTVGKIRYTRPIRVSSVVAAEIRAGNAFVVVHGIDYNHNGTYDNAALNRSDLRRSLPGEETAPALCGQLVAQKPSGSGRTKTARAPRVRGTQVFTASLNVQRGAGLSWLCHLGAPTEGDRAPA